VRDRTAKYVGVALLLLLALYVPFGVGQRNWLTPLNLAMAAAVGAIGLTILLGFTGQLSLAHPFFIAVGAYGYSFLSARHDPVTREVATSEHLRGLGLQPLLATVVIVAFAGLLGALFSPIAGRVKGIYLGIASLGLVFLTDHLLQNMRNITGGFNGRRVPTYDVVVGKISSCRPECKLLGHKFGQPERLWYVMLVAVVLSYVLARNMMRRRPGRALQALRDSETAASVMGVNLTRYRAMSFTVSSMFAGLSGVLYALANGNVTPAEFSVDTAILFLAMVVIGGVVSLGGAIAGALFVRILPDFITRHGEKIPFVAGQNDPTGLKPLAMAQILYGAIVILILLFEDNGLAGVTKRIWHRLTRRRPGARVGPTTEVVPVPSGTN
jgi:branched-chain amino acid transport system permease protein